MIQSYNICSCLHYAGSVTKISIILHSQVFARIEKFSVRESLNSIRAHSDTVYTQITAQKTYTSLQHQTKSHWTIQTTLSPQRNCTLMLRHYTRTCATCCTTKWRRIHPWRREYPCPVDDERHPRRLRAPRRTSTTSKSGLSRATTARREPPRRSFVRSRAQWNQQSPGIASNWPNQTTPILCVCTRAY